MSYLVVQQDYFASLSDENFEPPPPEDDTIENIKPITNMAEQGKAYVTEIVNHQF